MRGRGHKVALACACALATHATHTAQAGSCYGERPWRSFPEAMTAAPPNTHFWLFSPPDWDRRVCDETPKADPTEPKCREGEYALQLHAAPSAIAPRQALAADVHVYRSEKGAVTELVPRAALAAGRRYEVRLVDAQGREVRLVGTFRVQGPADHKAPSLAEIKSAERYRPPPVQISKSGARILTIDMYDSKPGVVVELAKPSRASFFAVWVGEPGKSIDFSAPPNTYDRANSGSVFELDLGGSDMCGASTFVIPDRDAVRIGIRAVDLAGNRSQGRGVDVKRR